MRYCSLCYEEPCNKCDAVKMKEFNVEKFLEERDISVDDLTHCDDLLLAIDEAYRQGYNQCLSDMEEIAKEWETK